VDAFVARDLFGLTKEDLAYVLDTFAIVEKRDRKAHGEYLTKRVILEIYDAMAEAALTGKPYETNLARVSADSGTVRAITERGVR